MTNLQVQEYMERGGRTVLVPVDRPRTTATTGPLWTDVYIRSSVCKRAAEELDALVGPPVPFGLAPDHRGASGLVYVRLETFRVAAPRHLRLAPRRRASSGSPLVNAHYVNSWAMQYAAAQLFDELPRGVRVYPFPYWQGLKPEEAQKYLSGSAGLHANVGETSPCWRSTRSCATWSGCATSRPNSTMSARVRSHC